MKTVDTSLKIFKDGKPRVTASNEYKCSTSKIETCFETNNSSYFAV